MTKQHQLYLLIHLITHIQFNCASGPKGQMSNFKKGIGYLMLRGNQYILQAVPKVNRSVSKSVSTLEAVCQFIQCSPCRVKDFTYIIV